MAVVPFAMRVALCLVLVCMFTSVLADEDAEASSSSSSSRTQLAQRNTAVRPASAVLFNHSSAKSKQEKIKEEEEVVRTPAPLPVASEPALVVEEAVVPDKGDPMLSPEEPAKPVTGVVLELIETSPPERKYSRHGRHHGSGSARWNSTEGRDDSEARWAVIRSVCLLSVAEHLVATDDLTTIVRLEDKIHAHANASDLPAYANLPSLTEITSACNLTIPGDALKMNSAAVNYTLAIPYLDITTRLLRESATYREHRQDAHYVDHLRLVLLVDRLLAQS